MICFWPLEIRFTVSKVSYKQNHTVRTLVCLLLHNNVFEIHPYHLIKIQYENFYLNLNFLFFSPRTQLWTKTPDCRVTQIQPFWFYMFFNWELHCAQSIFSKIFTSLTHFKFVETYFIKAKVSGKHTQREWPYLSRMWMSSSWSLISTCFQWV